MAAVAICSDFGTQKKKFDHSFHFPPSICHEVMGPYAMTIFWMLSFKPAFSLSSFSFIKRLFSSSSLYAIRVVASAYLRLLIFLLAILISTWASFSLAFRMILSAYKLNKQGTVYSLDVLFSRFGTSHLFHVWFYLLLLDLHAGFSGDR